MPRTLPWLSNGASSSTNESPATIKRKRTTTPPTDLVDSDLNPLVASPATSRARFRADRTPSTSPPRTYAPPEVELMREGYNADDVWMMVEDEFLATAQLYTRHLHHAEYVKLKKLARSRGQQTIQDIKRSTDGRTEQDAEARLRIEAGKRSSLIKESMKRAGMQDNGQDDDVDEYMHDAQLAGLMATEKTGGIDLSALTRQKSNTRAAAGFQQSPEKAEKFKAIDQRRVSAFTYGERSPTLPSRPFEETDEVSDTDDLDQPVRQSNSSRANDRPSVIDVISKSRDGHSVAQSHRPTRPSDVFKRFARTSEGREHGNSHEMAVSHNDSSSPSVKTRPSMQAQSSTNVAPMHDEWPSARNAQRTTSSDPPLGGYVREKAESKFKEDDAKRKDRFANSVPTWLA